MSIDPAALLHETTAGTDYPWLRGFAVYCNYDRSWLARTLSAARDQMAPATALSKTAGQRWMLLEDVSLTEARLFFIDWAADWNMAIPDRVLKVWADPEAVRPPMAEAV